MTLVAGGQYLVDRQTRHGLAKRIDTRHYFECFCPPLVGLRHYSGNRASVPGYDDGLAPLYGIEQLRKVSFGFRGLNFAHQFQPVDSTGRNITPDRKT